MSTEETADEGSVRAPDVPDRAVGTDAGSGPDTPSTTDGPAAEEGPVGEDGPAAEDGPVGEGQAEEVVVDVAALPGGAAAALEAVLMVADEPLTAVRLATALSLPTDEVERLLRELSAEYRGDTGGRPRGFELRQVGGGWRIWSAPAHADAVARFVLDGQTARLTHAALETLAVVAYRQPVTRGQVSAVRGVSVDSVMRTLVARGLVAEVGTEPSGAVLYGTTSYFLERLGMADLDDLPPLAPYLPDIDTLGMDDGDEGATR